MEADVAVVGGGPAGAVAAAALARAGRSVVLIDARPRPGAAIGETVPPSFVPEVSRWLPWDRVASELSVPSHGNRSAWGTSTLATHSFMSSPYGHGFHLDRARFDERLLGVAVTAGAMPILGRRVRGVEVDSTGGAVLSLAGAASIRVRGLVDATGRSAWLGRRLGARRELRDRLVGVVVQYARCEPMLEGFTQIEAVAEGWWYTAPLPDGHIVVTLMSDGDLVGRPAEMATAWEHRLRRAVHTHARLRGSVPVGRPRVVSAMSHRCRPTAGSVPWVAVGDAALGVDPLSGSGILRAFRTAAAGAAALARALDGDRAGLATYEHELDEQWCRYLARRSEHYARESRFPTATFWRRRGAWRQCLCSDP